MPKFLHLKFFQGVKCSESNRRRALRLRVDALRHNRRVNDAWPKPQASLRKVNASFVTFGVQANGLNQAQPNQSLIEDVLLLYIEQAVS